MFKQRRHRQFNYKPRHQGSEEEKSRAELEAKWNSIRQNTKKRGNFLSSLPVLIILLIMILVLMYILEGYIN